MYFENEKWIDSCFKKLFNFNIYKIINKKSVLYNMYIIVLARLVTKVSYIQIAALLPVKFLRELEKWLHYKKRLIFEAKPDRYFMHGPNQKTCLV